MISEETRDSMGVDANEIGYDGELHQTGRHRNSIVCRMEVDGYERDFTERRNMGELRNNCAD